MTARAKEARPVLSSQVAGRGQRGSRIRTSGRVRTVTFSASMSCWLFMTVMEEERNRANIDQNGIVFMETNNLETMPSES